MGTRYAAARIVNSLTHATNTVEHLPKFLLVLVDKDMFQEIDVFNEDTCGKIMEDLTKWMVRQISMIIWHKRLDLLEVRPGAIAGYATKIIFVRMHACMHACRRLWR